MNDTEKQKIRSEFEEEFPFLNSIKFTPNREEDYDKTKVLMELYNKVGDKITDYWLSILNKTIKSKLEAVEGDVKKVKQLVQKETGSFKYDDCYDDCIKIINKHK